MTEKNQQATTTAGVRGSFWDPSRLPPDTQFRSVTVTAVDGGNCIGVLAYRGGEKTVAMGMHPREYLPNNYLVPELLAGGVAVWTQAPRSIGNDIRLEHETAILDVAAGIDFLRGEGFEQVLLTGKSGGASLFAFYLAQANTPAQNRLARTPAGKPVPLQTVELPLADGAVFISPHPGQGKLLMNCIDPSVTDETDAMSVDEALNPFSAANGFKVPPESSRYSADFVERYRAAQRERVARLDAIARELAGERMNAKKRFKEGRNFDDMRRAAHTPIMTIWRTDADLRCFDLSIEPTSRAYGSLWGPNPLASNYGCVGFGRVCTADSWLSTWSGLSSNADMEKSAASITQPALVIRYDGDNSVFPSEAEAILEALASKDKACRVVPGNHHGRPVRDGDPNGQELAGETLRAWISERF